MEETINQRIAKYRKLRNITQDEMAHRFNLPRSSYARKEKYGKIDCNFLIEISKILDVDIRLLLFENEIDLTPTANITDDEWNLIALYRGVPKDRQNEIFRFALNNFKL